MGEGGEDESSLGHVKVQWPIGHPRRDAQGAFGLNTQIASLKAEAEALRGGKGGGCRVRRGSEAAAGGRRGGVLRSSEGGAGAGGRVLERAGTLSEEQFPQGTWAVWSPR